VSLLAIGVLNDTTQGLAALARPLRTRHSGFARKLPLREQHPSTQTLHPKVQQIEQ